MNPSAAGRRKGPTDWRDKVIFAAVLLSIVPFVIELSVTWSTFSHLNWASLVCFHAAVLGALVNIYAKVSKGVLPERRDVLSVLTAIFLAWAFDLYIVQKIAGH
jgi:hypothetical protein